MLHFPEGGRGNPELVLLLCLLFSSLHLALWFIHDLARRFMPFSFLICRVHRVLKDIPGNLENEALQELQWVWTYVSLVTLTFVFSQNSMELHKYKYLTLPDLRSRNMCMWNPYHLHISGVFFSFFWLLLFMIISCTQKHSGQRK